MKVAGRTFGDYELSENLFDSKLFDRAQFYRWLTGKNQEACEIIKAKVYVDDHLGEGTGGEGPPEEDS